VVVQAEASWLSCELRLAEVVVAVVSSDMVVVIFTAEAVVDHLAVGLTVEAVVASVVLPMVDVAAIENYIISPYGSI